MAKRKPDQPRRAAGIVWGAIAVTVLLPVAIFLGIIFGVVLMAPTSEPMLQSRLACILYSQSATALDAPGLHVWFTLSVGAHSRKAGDHGIFAFARRTMIVSPCHLPRHEDFGERTCRTRMLRRGAS